MPISFIAFRADRFLKHHYSRNLSVIYSFIQSLHILVNFPYKKAFLNRKAFIYRYLLTT